MNEIMEGAATDAQISGFAVALRIKGETPTEVTGLARAMLDHATPIQVPGRLVDLVGTGADGAHTVNISTMATVVAAAAGARMVKHGNRAASSKCGAADILEALGVAISLPPEASVDLAQEVGVAFLFAPLYHPALRYAGPPGASSGCRPSSTSWGRSRTRRGPRPRRWGWLTSGWAASSPACWPPGKPAPWCSTAGTGWTS